MAWKGRKTIGFKLILTLCVTMTLILALDFWNGLRENRASVEKQLEEKGFALAKSAAEAIGAVMEKDIRHGVITEEKLFDRKYTLYEDNAQSSLRKYHSAFDKYAEENWQRFMDGFLSDPDIAFAVAVAKSGDQATEGYLPVHNTKYQSRAKRIFNDETGAKAAATTVPLKQVYHRDTGEVMWDMSHPIMVNGKQWGAFRIGISIARAEEKLAAARNKSVLYMLLVILVSNVVLVISSKIIVGRPLKQILAATENLASGQGDLRQRLPEKSQDELGVLSGHINRFIAQIQDTVRYTADAADQVSLHSDQLARAATDTADVSGQIAACMDNISQGAKLETRSVEKTYNAIQELSKAVGQLATGSAAQTEHVGHISVVVSEMAAAIEDVANSTQSVSTAALQTVEAAQKGGKAVKLTISGMDEIKKTVYLSARKIKELGDSSQQIGEIISVIDDIAEQTNLLALNAAIEAARAGENGKGFAVVADEVRKLAERSSRATKEISTIIQAIRKGTENAVEAMEVGTQEVEKGVRLAQEAGTALEEIINTVEKTNDEIVKISAATEQITASSADSVDSIRNISQVVEETTGAVNQIAASNEEVNGAIEQVSAIAEGNNAAAQEVAAAAEEISSSTEESAQMAQSLAKMAHELKEMLKRFSY